MPVIGIPMDMFLVFVATVLAGSLGAIHYLVVHVLMGQPVTETTLGQATEESGADGS